LTSKKGIVLAQFKISKGKKTPHCSRPIRSKTGDNKGKESKSNRGVEISVFTILDLLLLHKSWVFNLVLVPTYGRSPGTLRIYQGHHLDISNSLSPGLTTNLIIDEIVGRQRDGKITPLLGREMGKTLTHFMIIIHYRKVQALEFFLEG
jgi:hypothetical protein